MEFGGTASKWFVFLLLLPTGVCFLASLVWPFAPTLLPALAEAGKPAIKVVMSLIAEGDRVATIRPARLAIDDLVISFCLVALTLQAVVFCALTAAYRHHIAGWIAFKFKLAIAEWFWRDARRWIPCAAVALAAALDIAFGGYLMLFFERHADGELVSFGVTLLRVGLFSFLMSGLMFSSFYHLLYLAFATLARLERGADS